MFDVFLMIVAGISVVYVICDLFYKGMKETTTPKITFKEFLNFYEVNSDKWDTGEYLYYDYEGPCHQLVEFKTFFDCMRYKIWCGKKQKKNNQKVERDNELKILEDIQRDIERVIWRTET